MSASPALEVFDRYVVELEQLAADKRATGDSAELIELDIRRTKQARESVERLIAAANDVAGDGCPCEPCELLRRAVNECRGGRMKRLASFFSRHDVREVAAALTVYSMLVLLLAVMCWPLVEASHL